MPGPDVVEALEQGLRVDPVDELLADEPRTTATTAADEPSSPTASPRMPGPSEAGEPDKLQKVLARAGVGSPPGLRGADRGRPGHASTAWWPTSVSGSIPRASTIEVDGVPVAADPALVHYLLNKPAGVVTTADDPQGRPTVIDLVPAEPRVFPVGRLDLDTEGLLVVTNDGALAHRLTHPSFGDREGVPGRGGGHAEPGGPARPCVRGSSSTTAAPPPPAPRWSATGSCASPSTRVATARCGACARPSATRSAASSAPASAPSPTGPWPPAPGAPSPPKRSAGLVRRIRGAPRSDGRVPARDCRSAGPAGRHHHRRRHAGADRGAGGRAPASRCSHRNEVDHDDLISVIFTATEDIVSTFPATAARTYGLGDVPLICARELSVEGGTPLCIRVLLHLTTERSRQELHHVYLEGARGLRDDLPD